MLRARSALRIACTMAAAALIVRAPIWNSRHGTRTRSARAAARSLRVLYARAGDLYAFATPPRLECRRSVGRDFPWTSSTSCCSCCWSPPAPDSCACARAWSATDECAVRVLGADRARALRVPDRGAAQAGVVRMNGANLLQLGLYLGLLLLLVKPLGAYMAAVFADTPNRVTRLGAPLERAIYRLCGVAADE